ncbi:MAG: MarR family transcriptional regulator [Alphaproteobacteria bacterium]|nr:MarR family transcriptional regulator [Alphaproteobacteria bacterium]
MTALKPDHKPLFLRDEDLRLGIELLYFGYRDFTADLDAILAEYDMGRAHCRVLYFVGRVPGMSVAELLDILRITKQSLARVLRQLLDQGFVVQRRDSSDGRKRLLELTARGHELEQRLSETQLRIISRAFHEAGPDAVAGFRTVMLEIVNAADRKRFTR